MEKVAAGAGVGSCVWPTLTSSTLQGVLPFQVGLTVQTKDAEVFRLLDSRDQALDIFFCKIPTTTHIGRGEIRNIQSWDAV